MLALKGRHIGRGGGKIEVVCSNFDWRLSVHGLVESSVKQTKQCQKETESFLIKFVRNDCLVR